MLDILFMFYFRNELLQTKKEQEEKFYSLY
jgi:hypothetical protein